MKLEDLNKIYSNGYYNYQEKIAALGEKYYTKKVLPKILKGIKKGEEIISFHCCGKDKDAALQIYLPKIGLKFDRHNSDAPFVVSEYRIWGWKLEKPEPDDILKKNL